MERSHAEFFFRLFFVEQLVQVSIFFRHVCRSYLTDIVLIQILNAQDLPVPVFQTLVFSFACHGKAL